MHRCSLISVINQDDCHVYVYVRAAESHPQSAYGLQHLSFRAVTPQSAGMDGVYHLEHQYLKAFNVAFAY